MDFDWRELTKKPLADQGEGEGWVQLDRGRAALIAGRPLEQPALSGSNGS
jgi:hypothetical protein